MLLLNEILKKIDVFSELEIKFVKAILADEEIFLKKLKKTFLLMLIINYVLKSILNKGV